MDRWTVVEVYVDRWRYRWFGRVMVGRGERTLALPMTGVVAQWLLPGDPLELELTAETDRPGFDDYRLWKPTPEGPVQLWPVHEASLELVRRSPLDDRPIYTYSIRLREAVRESDYTAIVDLEQYHYAAEEAVLAKWACLEDGAVQAANIRPTCPRCHQPMRFWDLTDATRSSRFLLAELLNGQPYEPKFIGYVRVDPPIPAMHRRLPDGSVQRDIRRQVFPPDWFEPTYWPEAYYRAWRSAQPEAAPEELWARAEEEALKGCSTRAARIARVVVHPDYRGEGLGYTLVNGALHWISARRIPEARRTKAVVETVAMMARYNPFFERAGFRYLWDTASGRPVLYRGLIPEAEALIDRFLEADPVGRQHRGRLYRPQYRHVEPLAGPIRFENVSKVYQSWVTLEKLPPALQEVLRSFGVERRLIQKFVLRNLWLRIEPGEVIALVGASGAGKTTVLRLIWGRAAHRPGWRYRVDGGRVVMPPNVRGEAYLPGETEPEFGNLSILEAVYRREGWGVGPSAGNYPGGLDPPAGGACGPPAGPHPPGGLWGCGPPHLTPRDPGAGSPGSFHLEGLRKFLRLRQNPGVELAAPGVLPENFLRGQMLFEVYHELLDRKGPQNIHQPHRADEAAAAHDADPAPDPGWVAPDLPGLSAADDETCPRLPNDEGAGRNFGFVALGHFRSDVVKLKGPFGIFFEDLGSNLVLDGQLLELPQPTLRGYKGVVRAEHHLILKPGVRLPDEGLGNVAGGPARKVDVDVSLVQGDGHLLFDPGPGRVGQDDGELGEVGRHVVVIGDRGAVFKLDAGPARQTGPGGSKAGVE